jgi:hypothetical protein
MIRRSAERQARTCGPISMWADLLPNDLVTRFWESLVADVDLRVVDAASSGIVITVPREAVRRGDLLVRNPDDSFGSFRLIARRGADAPPAPPATS